HAVCPGKKQGQTIRTAVHDFEGDQTYTEKRGHNFSLNATFDEVKEDEYDALFLPGGRAPEYLRLNPRVIEIVKSFKQQDKPIAAVCHGVQFLTAADVVRGKKLTGYPACGPEVTQSGGRWQDIAIDQATVDGNLITAPAWPAHPACLAKPMEVL